MQNMQKRKCVKNAKKIQLMQKSKKKSENKSILNVCVLVIFFFHLIVNNHLEVNDKCQQG